MCDGQRGAKAKFQSCLYPTKNTILRNKHNEFQH